MNTIALRVGRDFCTNPNEGQGTFSSSFHMLPQFWFDPIQIGLCFAAGGH